MQNRQLKIGALLSYSALIINILLTLFYTPWMVSRIGQSSYGLFTLATSLIGMFMLDFGLGNAVTKFVSKYNAKNDKEGAEQFLGIVFRLYVLIDVVILVIFTIFYLLLGDIYKGLTAEELHTFRKLFLIVAGFNLLAFPMTPLNGILNGYEKFAYAKLCDLVHRFLMVALVVAALFFTSDVTVLVVANALAGTIAIALKWLAVKFSLRIRIGGVKNDRTLFRDIFSFSIWSTVVGIAQRLTYNLAPSILAITSGSIAAAIYAPASAIGSYYYSIAMAVNGLFLPRISRMVYGNRENELFGLMIKVGRYQTAILGLVLVGFFCIGDSFVTLWMGEEFTLAYPCTVLIMIPALIEYSQQIGNTAIIVKDQIKTQAIIRLIISVAGCALAFFLSYRWGAIGACVAIGVTGLANVAGNNYIHAKKLGIPIVDFYWKCYASMLLPLFGTAVCGRWVSLQVKMGGLGGLLIKGSLVAAIYACLMCFFGLKKTEKSAILQRCRKIICKSRG